MKTDFKGFSALSDEADLDFLDLIFGDLGGFGGRDELLVVVSVADCGASDGDFSRGLTEILVILFDMDDSFLIKIV